MERINTFWHDESMPYVELRTTEKSSDRYKPHSHRELCVGAVTEGTIQFSTADETLALSPGSLVLLNPLQVHSCNSVEDQPRSYFMIYLDGDWCRSIQEGIFGRCPELKPLTSGVLDDSKLYRAFIELAETLCGDGDTLEKTVTLVQFATDLFRRRCEGVTAEAAAKPSGTVEEIKDHLTRRISRNLTLNQLADTFAMNPYHLLRQFKREVGLPPHTFLLNVRIEEAKRLLREGSTPATVAQAVGFSDQSHFHRTFRKIVAATPREYQRGHK
jgi:AraC-like DNA-binding protein